jgi:transcriptional regulator with XRE-family HTH domain
MDNKEVGRRLRERRAQLGLTQEELAETLSVGPNTISRWETGERSIAITDLPRVASALCIEPAYFFPTAPRQERSEIDVRLTPLFDELRLSASRGFLTPELADDILDFIRFKNQQAARGRRKSDRNAP